MMIPNIAARIVRIADGLLGLPHETPAITAIITAIASRIMPPSPCMCLNGIISLLHAIACAICLDAPGDN
ncbi:MAG: hypothetical protein ACLP7P_16505 [Rhodomicrobium sp.]